MLLVSLSLELQLQLGVSVPDAHLPLPGIRVKPYLTQIVSTILWRLNNKSAKVRQQAADLTTRLAVVIKQCGEDAHLSKVSLVLPPPEFLYASTDSAFSRSSF